MHPFSKIHKQITWPINWIRYLQVVDWRIWRLQFHFVLEPLVYNRRVQLFLTLSDLLWVTRNNPRPKVCISQSSLPRLFLYWDSGRKNFNGSIKEISPQLIGMTFFWPILTQMNIFQSFKEHRVWWDQSFPNPLPFCCQRMIVNLFQSLGGSWSSRQDGITVLPRPPLPTCPSMISDGWEIQRIQVSYWHSPHHSN